MGGGWAGLFFCLGFGPGFAGAEPKALSAALCASILKV